MYWMRKTDPPAVRPLSLGTYDVCIDLEGPCETVIGLFLPILLGMRVRKWPKQESVNNREERGVCADSQSQRQDDGHSE